MAIQDLSIRRADQGDAGAIHRVIEAAFRGLEGRGYSSVAIEAAIITPQEIAERLAEGGYVLVAEVDGQIIGTATGLEEHQSLHVCSVAVHPDCQGRGVARLLMERLEALARSLGCHKLFLQTAWAMTEAMALYESLGYQREGYQPRHFYGEDFILYGKVLEGALDDLQSTG
ncbi:MAG: GNAT family N-acetyltransferase [Anaerolineae bacterium]